MKTYLVASFILLLFCSNAAFAQRDSIGISTTGKPYVDKHFNVSKVYYKGTDIQMPKETFHALVSADRNLFLEKVIDDAGTVTRYLYDPQNPLGVGKMYLKNAPADKSSFPNFKLKTITNEDVELSNLRGKFVILRFELEATTFRFKKHEIKDLDAQINALADKAIVEAIIIFNASKSEVRQGFDLADSNFKLVTDGRTLAEKYGITRFPSTVLIDQDGNLIKIFKNSDDISLVNLFRN